MGVLDKIDDGGRVIAGLLGYNPGPGLYSRMSRAVEQMPKVIRTQELPGLLRKYPEGVPGWEVKAVAPALEGVESIPRQDLLDLIQQHSPAYTHKEVVLGGKPQQVFQPEYYVGETPSLAGDLIADFQRRQSPLGAGVSHGVARYRDYGQGGDNYSEVLLLQPNALGEQFSSHWHGQSGAPGVRAAVAHARFDTHGDALRINELQSDLGIHNRKIREIENGPNVTARYGDQVYATDDMGVERPIDPQLPFPLEDAWADILIKRLALEAARGGHRAIEVASPRAIADKVGGNIDNYEHFYGKVVPGAIERLGRKMGGMTPDASGPELVRRGYTVPEARQAAEDALGDLIAKADGYVGSGRGKGQVSSASMVEDVAAAMRLGADPTKPAVQLRDHLVSLAMENGYPPQAAKTLVNNFMPQLMSDAGNVAALANTHTRLWLLHKVDKVPEPLNPPGRRYVMSDEMRRRILQQGIGLGVLGPLLGEAGTNSEEN